MPPHPGSQMVQREQVGQGGRVGRLLLQRVDQPQLPLQQRLVPPGQADEDLAQADAQPGLTGGGRDRGPLQPADGRDGLVDLDAAGARPGRALLGQPGVLAVPQPLHGLRQLLVGQPPGGLGEVGQIPGQLPGERAHQHYRTDDDDEAASAEQDHLGHLRVGHGGQVVIQAGAEYHGQRPQRDQAGDRQRDGSDEGEPDRPARGARLLRTRRARYAHLVTPGSIRRDPPLPAGRYP